MVTATGKIKTPPDWTTGHIVAFVVADVIAIAFFVYTVWILGFEQPPLGRSLHKTAGWLAAIWAVGPPLWFMGERWLWATKRNAKKLATAQEHVRDFWLGLGAIVLFLAAKQW